MKEVTRTPSACLCFKKEEHTVAQEQLQNNYTFNTLLNSATSSPTTSWYPENLLYLGMSKNTSKSTDKVDSFDPLYKKIPDRSLPQNRVKILSNNIFDHIDVRHSFFSASPNDDVKLGLKKRTEILVKQLKFAVLFRIASLKTSLIACSEKGVLIEKEKTDTQSGSYATPNERSFLQRSLDNIDLTNQRKFDECHVAAITSIKNSHQNIDDIILRLKSSTDISDIDSVIADYFLLGQEPSIKLLRAFIVNKDEAKLISEICSQIKREHFGKASCLHIFKQILKTDVLELKQSLYSLAPDMVNEIIKGMISELNRTDKKIPSPDEIKEREERKEKIIQEYNFLNPTAPLDPSTRTKKSRAIKVQVKHEEVLLKLIFTLRKDKSDQIDTLMSIVNHQFPQPEIFRDFVFESLGKDIKDLQNCIFGHFLPLNSIAGIMGTQTITMQSEINHGIDAETDILGRTFVPELLSSFSKIKKPVESDLQDAVQEFENKLFQTYEGYANSKNNGLLVTPKLEELVDGISEPDEEMQKIFYELDKNPSLQEIVLLGLSYIGYLSDINQDKVTIGSILNYMSDPDVLQNKINELNQSLISGNQKTNTTSERMIKTFTKILHNFNVVRDTINQLNIPESIKNREIETAPYGSMHNFILKNEASIAMFCANAVQNYKTSNFEHKLLGKDLQIEDVDIVRTPAVNFHLCEGRGDQFCWERV